MKERPILFSAPMVRAILEGRKTQTRRIAKPRRNPSLLTPGEWSDEYVLHPGNRDWLARDNPYGQPGDRLWVRETWAFHKMAIGSVCDEDGPFVYRATDGEQSRLCDRWRPSIHMPRYAGRILLETTGVRVERLQDISPADAMAEGVQETGDGAFHIENDTCRASDPVECYARLWEAINGAGSWAANPWVWCISFRRVE